MRATPLAQRIVDHVDHHHPKLGSAVLKARWGGLRSIEPSAPLVVGVVGAGAAGGLVLRRAVGHRSGGVARIPAGLAVPVGVAMAWLSLWRWDSSRWSGSHVTLVLDMTEQELDELIDTLAAMGIDARRWYGRRQAGATSGGVTCRSGDVRRVNALIGGAVPGLTG